MSSIKVQSLCYATEKRRILQDINLDVQTGEILSIMGPSGSGKTTLLKVMTGLLKPTSGTILIDDINITDMKESALDRVRLRMGLVFQYAALFDSLTVYDNIIFGVIRHNRTISRKELDTIVTERLEQVGLPGIARQMPAELSGGMQKRVGLARALAMKPSLVFYDEPTSGLDPVTALAIDELITNTRNSLGVTSIIVSHQLQSIFRISDRVAMLSEGQIVMVGTPKEVLASDNLIVQAFLKPERSILRGSA